MEKELRKTQKRKEVPNEVRLRALSDPDRMWALRMRFLEQCKQYYGVPYAKRYWKPEDPLYNSKLFLDCCGLIRRVLKDLKKDFGFKIGPWNQAYMFDTLPITVETEEAMKPGDLVFIRAVYYNPKSKKQKHNMVHVEIWSGEAPKSIGARWQRGTIQEFDSYKFVSTSYHSMEYIFKSIDTWLMGICRSHCSEHQWRTSSQNFKPSKKSIFSVKQKKKNKIDGNEENSSSSESEEQEEAADSPGEDSQNEDDVDTAGKPRSASSEPLAESDAASSQNPLGGATQKHKKRPRGSDSRKRSKKASNVRSSVKEKGVKNALQSAVAKSLVVQSVKTDRTALFPRKEDELNALDETANDNNDDDEASQKNGASTSISIEPSTISQGRILEASGDAHELSSEIALEEISVLPEIPGDVKTVSAILSAEKNDGKMSKQKEELSGGSLPSMSGVRSSSGGSKPGSPIRTPLSLKPVSIQHSDHSTLRTYNQKMDALKYGVLDNPDAKISVLSILQYSIKQNQKYGRTHMQNRMAVSGAGMRLSPSSSRTSSPTKSRRSLESLSSSSTHSLETLSLGQSEENLHKLAPKGALRQVALSEERACHSDSETYATGLSTMSVTHLLSAPAARPSSAPETDHLPPLAVSNKPEIKVNPYCFQEPQDISEMDEQQS